MSENIWSKLSRPPASALRAIQAGRLKGKSDINPIWRYKIMTEVFGQCGEGWKFEIVRLWTEPGSEGQVFSFAHVNLFIHGENGWNDPIPGIGGHFLVVKESSGLHSNDEGFKMAVTDALGTAMKMLGVAADIYAGMWDGTKYKETFTSPLPAPRTAGPKPLPPISGTTTTVAPVHTTYTQPMPPVAPTVAPGEELRGTVEEVKTRSGEKNGKEWNSYSVKIGGQFYSTFSDTDGANAQDWTGQEVFYTWKSARNPQYKDLASIRRVDDSTVEYTEDGEPGFMFGANAQ
jgi:hypothetical protein